MTPRAVGSPGLRLRAPAATVPLGAVLLGVTALLGLAVGFFHLDGLRIPLCTFKAVTGLPCFTCGTTRALGRLFTLDPLGALAMNPLATLGALGLVLWGVADLALMTRGRALAVDVSPRLARGLWWAGLVLLLSNWVYLLAAGR